jgi:hypothetical protein
MTDPLYEILGSEETEDEELEMLVETELAMDANFEDGEGGGGLEGFADVDWVEEVEDWINEEEDNTDLVVGIPGRTTGTKKITKRRPVFKLIRRRLDDQEKSKETAVDDKIEEVMWHVYSETSNPLPFPASTLSTAISTEGTAQKLGTVPRVGLQAPASPHRRTHNEFDEAGELEEEIEAKRRCQ